MVRYRVVTRPDFDGIVCAVLIGAALRTNESPLWLEPYEFGDAGAEISSTDVVANLPFAERAAYWFDHHYTNDPEGRPIQGSFWLAPSAARVIYEYFYTLSEDWDELVAAADKIDSAAFSEEEILHPEHDPYQRISLTLDGKRKEDEGYWNWLVAGLRTGSAEDVADDPDVRRRSDRVIEANEEYKLYLSQYTTTQDNVSITDFRSLEEPPSGLRFTVFPLFPDTNVNVKVRYSRTDPNLTVISMGHSVTNRTCSKHLGELAGTFGGGGHMGAAAFSVRRGDDDRALQTVIRTLRER